jgi:hypothetical protein
VVSLKSRVFKVVMHVVYPASRLLLRLKTWCFGI